MDGPVLAILKKNVIYLMAHARQMKIGWLVNLDVHTEQLLQTKVNQALLGKIVQYLDGQNVRGKMEKHVEQESRYAL